MAERVFMKGCEAIAEAAVRVYGKKNARSRWKLCTG